MSQTQMEIKYVITLFVPIQFPQIHGSSGWSIVGYCHVTTVDTSISKNDAIRATRLNKEIFNM